MLNGHVHRDNIHGNVNSTSTIYNINMSPPLAPSESAETTEASTRNGFSESERKELIDCLRFPQLDARLTNLRKAVSKTCNWIMQRKDYKTWLDSDNLEATDGFFWIKGNPGTGKSITMKFLYQAMQRRKNSKKLVISFFFNARGNEFEKSALGLYRALLFNLFDLEPNLQDALDHCRRSGYHNILESGWQLQNLKEVFEESVLMLQGLGKQLYCYIDALDECPEQDVRDMISYFEDLVSRTDSRNLRVCFSSRHYPQVIIMTKSVSSKFPSLIYTSCGHQS